MEAVYRDYGPKGVKFYFVYKALAHPELVGDYLQPFTLDERLAQARLAGEELGSSIPWLVDSMENEFKERVGKRANSEFILDPEGVIVRKRALSDPSAVRQDLENLVGPTEQITREEDVKLKMRPPLRTPAARGLLPRLQRLDMIPLKVDPVIIPGEVPFFAKLRVEAEPSLLDEGQGELYLGFHLDPLHRGHWNNLTPPLSFRLDLPEGVKISPEKGTGPKLDVSADADPREFILFAEAWPVERTLKLTTRYFACVGEESCFDVRQEYRLSLERDPFAGRAFWEASGIGERMLLWDGDQDGRLSQTEARMSETAFRQFDGDGDGFLDSAERESVWDWLNRLSEQGVERESEKQAPSRTGTESP